MPVVDPELAQIPVDELAGAPELLWASKMDESLQRSNTCFTRSEGLVITKLPPMAFSFL